MTTLSAVAMAGGLTCGLIYGAVEDYAEAIRTVGGRGQARWVLIDPNSFIAPGDGIEVSMRHFRCGLTRRC